VNFDQLVDQMASSAGTSNQSNPFTRKKRNPQKPSRLIQFCRLAVIDMNYVADIITRDFDQFNPPHSLL
jgi:hypothetical protein